MGMYELMLEGRVGVILYAVQWSPAKTVQYVRGSLSQEATHL